MMVMSMNYIRFIVNIISNILSFVLFASRMQRFCRIIKIKSVEEFHAYPYLAYPINCLMWIHYGMPFINPHNILVVTINIVGLFHAVVLYFHIVLLHWQKISASNKFYLFGEIMGLAIAEAGTMLDFHTYTSRTTVHWILATTFEICMYGSPLLIMYKVNKTKSAEFLPKKLSIVCFLNVIFWAFYSLLKFDSYILTGNGVEHY